MNSLPKTVTVTRQRRDWDLARRRQVRASRVIDSGLCRLIKLLVTLDTKINRTLQRKPLTNVTLKKLNQMHIQNNHKNQSLLR